MLIPPFFIDCVAAIGTMRPKPTDGQLEWRTLGTGFFYGLPLNRDEEDDLSKRHYAVFLVTAKHVITPYIGGQTDVRIRLDSKDTSQPVRDFELPRIAGGQGNWFFHPNPDVDIGVIHINWNYLKAQGIEPAFFAERASASLKATLKDWEVAAGDSIYVLGFPMGLTGKQRNYVVVRQGCIARIHEMFDDASTGFLIDASVYPGNSGGPVILRPEMFSIEGTKNPNYATLLGMVTGYLSYQDTAVSLQTNQPRIIFQENSGLANVLPVDLIEETISAYMTKFRRAPETDTGAEPKPVEASS